MNQYDFETAPRRENVGSGKWNEIAQELGSIPEGVIPFSVADMELANAPEIIEGLTAYLRESVLGYTSPTAEYLSAVARWMERRHNWKIEPEWIINMPGVVCAFFNAVKAFTQEGEGVMLMTPVYYPMYMAIERNHRRLVDVPLIRTEDSYEINFALMEEKAADPNTKLLLLCSPHNPCSRVWKREELEHIGRICMKNNVLVVSDEIHFDLIMPGYRHTVYAAISDDFAQNCVVCTAPSKTFNLAGLHTSNIIIPNAALRARYVEEYQKVAGFASCNMLGLEACRLAYENCEEWLDEAIGLIDRNRQVITDFLAREIPKIRVMQMEGTYLLWLDFNALGLNSRELSKILREKAYLFFDDGFLFGEAGDGFERWNLACPTHCIEEALIRLKSALEPYI